MTRKDTAKFWSRAFMADEERPLKAAEEDLIAVTVTRGESRWDGTCDVARMGALVDQNASVLDTIGPALVNITSSTRGCVDALRFLLERDVPFLIEEYRAKEGKQYEYDVMHEASWAGCVDNLRVLFESGVADATGTANPHTGWPDNVTLLYWPAVFGTANQRDGVRMTELLLEHGADPEIRIKGNGERGNTVLQEAVSPGADPHWTDGKREVAKVLLTSGAHYDVFSACALDDTDRLLERVEEDPDVATSLGEADTTPLHWAGRAGSLSCAEWLLNHGAQVNTRTKAKRTALHLAAENDAAEAIELLAEHNADLDVQDTKGRTPLHRATYQGQVNAAEALIGLGADTEIEMKSSSGQ